MIPDEKINPNLTYVENLVNYVLNKNNQEGEKEELDEEEKAKKLFENLSKLKNST
jgi:hypothetical protein